MSEDHGDAARFDPDEGGDAACWSNRVCPECGRLNASARPVVCEACGTEFPPDLSSSVW